MAVSVSLLPMAGSPKQQRDLTSLVGQIYKERRHMRFVTSEALKNEIGVEGAPVPDASSLDAIDVEDAPPDAEAKLKSLFEAREEMMTLVGEANNEVLMLQDFMSLLLSKDAPNAAKSMSPALKELVPANTFAFDRTPAALPEAHDLERAQSQADGFGFQTLNATADRLLSSATRLEQEVTKETKYWDQILSVTQQGWNVTQVRGSAHALGVHYACSEAAPQYQARGLASLRPSDDGDLIIDTGTSDTTKCLRVRLISSGQVFETSSLPQMLERESSALEDMVHQARDSLFDEELFHLLSTEARNLLAHGVTEKSGCIIVPRTNGLRLEGRRQPDSTCLIVIDLIDRDQISPAQGRFAECIAMFLRLGLNHAYRERHNRRIRPPAPISNRTTDLSAIKLLMSIVTLDEHHRAVHALQETFAELLTPLTTAGVPYSFTINRDLNPKLDRTGKERMISGPNSQSLLDRLFESSQGFQRTSFELKLPPASDIIISTSTDFSAPQYGTKHIVESTSANVGPIIIENGDEGLQELRARLETLVQKSLIAYLADATPDWTASADDTNLLSETHEGRKLSLRLLEGKLTVCATASGQKQGPVTLLVIEGKQVRKAPGITFKTLVDVLPETAELFM